jgi:hypothetical protein
MAYERGHDGWHGSTCEVVRMCKDSKQDAQTAERTDETP